MKKGIFGSWFKEFATLVLTQTVQAFLLAIVMTIIVSCLAESDQSGSSANAAGLLAIVALASFNKVELLVKNIFGVTSQFGDPSMTNGRGITAGGMLAWRGAMRLKDNFSKSKEGNRMIEQGQQGIRNLEAQKLDANKGLNSGTNTDENNNELGNETQHQLQEQVMRLQTMDDIGALTQAIRNLTSETRKANTDKTQDKMKEYEEMIRAGQQEKRKAVFENVGATLGAGAGAIVGLAQGEDIAKTTLAGAGAGDAIGEGIGNSKSKKENHEHKMSKLKQDYQSAIDNYNAQVKTNIDNMISQGSVDTEKYAKDALDQYQASKLKADISINKAGLKPSASKDRELKQKLKTIQDRLDNNTKAGD